MILYYLDLLGTFAFAVTGAYKAKISGLSLFGVVFLGTITAIGGGTFRDLILGRTPMFYLMDPSYFMLSIFAGTLIYFAPTFFQKNYSFFRFIDSIGLAIFTVIGVSISFNHLAALADENRLLLFLPSIFLGMITGFGGGILRDMIMGDVPLSLRKNSNYALSAFCGSFVFFAFMFLDQKLSIAVSLVVTLFLREIISPYGLYSKVFANFRLKPHPHRKKAGS